MPIAESARGSQRVTLSAGLMTTFHQPMIEGAALYLVSHRGRWVPAWELADHLYGGHCGRSTVRMLVLRLRRRGLEVESGPFGYRVGRSAVRECDRCGGRMVRYEDEWVCYGCPGTGVVDLEVGRSPAVGERGGREWTEEDRARLREMWLLPMKQDAIGEVLGRSASAVRAEAATLGLGRKPYVRGRG